jgi:hypothetical protein
MEVQLVPDRSVVDGPRTRGKDVSLPHRSLRRFSTVGALLVAPALLVGAPAKAQATAAATKPAVRPASQHAVRTLDVVGSPIGFTAPSRRRAGIATFRVSTTDPAGIRLGLFRLRPGVPLDRFVGHLRQTLTGERDEAVVAGRQVSREAVLLGGVATEPGSPAAFTQVLRAGTYHLIDYEDIEEGGPGRPVAVHPLVVTDSIDHDQPARPDALIRMVETPRGPRFHAPRELRSGESVLITNLSAQLDEAIFMPVRPGTTSAEVQRFFEAAENGEWPESPFVGVPRGMPVIAPGQSAVLGPELPPGEYALVSWVFDLDNGAARAAQGMHALVTVR